MELSRFDHLIAHTRYSLKRLELWGMAADRISVIRGGRFDHYEELEESGQTGASEDLTGGEHRILCFGALSLYKGVDLLIRALAQLPEATLHKARLMIYGDEAVDELVYSTDVATMREKGL
jgi:glycosyltransferase involved in cell wall biosynthesis